MTDSKTREAFEAWAVAGAMSVATLDRLTGYPKGTYEDSRTHASWLGWQASRKEALEEAAKAAETVGAEMVSEAKENKFLTSAGRDAYTSAWAGAKNCSEAIRGLADETREG